jgi:hypothetical protein
MGLPPRVVISSARSHARSGHSQCAADIRPAFATPPVRSGRTTTAGAEASNGFLASFHGLRSGRRS